LGASTSTSTAPTPTRQEVPARRVAREIRVTRPGPVSLPAGPQQVAGRGGASGAVLGGAQPVAPQHAGGA